jgi:Spy/CpxP family protein refolding chaperone
MSILSGSLAERGTRSRRSALSLSILLNLFLLAFLLAQHLRPLHPHAPDEHGEFARVIGEMSAALSPEDAARLHAAFTARTAELEAAHRAFGTAMAEVRARIAQTPFDPAQLRAAMDAAGQQRQAMGQLFASVILAAVPEMTPAGRLALSRMHVHR